MSRIIHTVENMERDKGLELLARRGWLSRVDDEFRETLLENAEWRSFDAAEQITLAGDAEGDLIGLAEGFVAFHIAFGQPSAPILHIGSPVFWMGYRPIVADEARIATATAQSKVWCATIKRRRVRAMLDDRPDWWRHFVTLSLEYGDAAALSGADLLIANAEARLIAVLLRFAGLRGAIPNDDPVLVPVTQQELAGATNLSRNWVGTILRKLATAGWIETRYNGIEITDRDALLSALAAHET